MRFSAVDTADHFLSTGLAERVRPLARGFDALWAGNDETAVAQRMSFIAFFVRIVSAGIAFLSQVVLARWMGAFDFGIYVFVWTAMVIMGSLSCLGFQTAVIRFLPEYRRFGDLARLRGILVTSRIFVLVSATIFAAVAMAVIWAVRGALESYYVMPFVLGLTCLPMLALGDVLEGTARANSWPLRALAPTYIVRPTLLLVYFALAQTAGMEASALTGVLAAVLAAYTTTLVQLFALTRKLDILYPGDDSRREIGLWAKVALPIFLVEGFFFLLTNADVLMVGIFLPPSDVAVYFATVKTLALVHFVFFAVKAGVAQQFAARTGIEDRNELRAFARRTVAWTFWPSLAMALVVLGLGTFLLALFGQDYVAGYPLLFILVSGVVLRAAIGPAESLLNMTGNQNICAAIFAAVLVVNIVANLVLIPSIGLAGAAIATAGATVVEAGLLFFIAWRRIGVVMFVFAPRQSEELAA